MELRVAPQFPDPWAVGYCCQGRGTRASTSGRRRVRTILKWGQESTSTSWEAGFPLATVITVPRTCTTRSLSPAGQRTGDRGMPRVPGVLSSAGEGEQ